MNTSKRVLIGVVIVASVAVPLVLHRLAQSKLHSKTQVIQQQAGLLSELEAARATLVASSKPVKKPGGLSEAEQIELLRLRHEAGVLRRMTNAMPQARDENRQLRDRLTATKTAPAVPAQTSPPVTFPKESWSFAGYATPEAGFQSFIWGMSRGDSKAIMASMTDKAASDFAETMARSQENNTDYTASLSRGMEKMSGIQVRREVLSESEVLMEISTVTDGATRKGKILRMKKVGTEWKLDEKF